MNKETKNIKKTTTKKTTTKRTSKASKAKEVKETKVVNQQEETNDEILDEEKDLILDVSEIKPVVEKTTEDEEGELDVYIEVPEEEIVDEGEDEEEKNNDEEAEQNEEYYNSLPKTTLNEIRKVKRDIKKEEKIKEEEQKRIEEMPTVQENPIELSKMAQNWKAWLEYQRIKPEDFIRRYPDHKFIQYIKEIIKKG